MTISKTKTLDCVSCREHYNVRDRGNARGFNLQVIRVEPNAYLYQVMDDVTVPTLFLDACEPVFSLQYVRTKYIQGRSGINLK